MATLTTGELTLSDEILDPWLGKIQGGSVIAALGSAIPMKFGTGKSFTFDIGEAEYVAEGGEKGATDITSKTVTTAPFKFHKTVRWTQEVMWADEDEQTRVVQEVLGLIQPALSRALDYGIIHGVNPATGNAAAAMTTKLADATNSVEFDGATDVAYEALDAADALVLGGLYVPSGFAMDPTYAAKFSNIRNNGVKQYPNLSFGTAVSEVDGHRTSVSRTVSGAGVVADSGLLGIVGDFDAIRWGIQREIGLELIEFGDPDGGGDLKRRNEVAFRMEVVYGWGIADLDAFALITEPAGA